MKNPKRKKYGLLALLIALSALGMLYHVHERRIRIFRKSLLKQDEYVYQKVHPFYKTTDVSSLISIEGEKDVFEKRDRLIQYIWRGKGFPDSHAPNDIKRDIRDDRYSDWDNLERIEKITVVMEYGINSVIYLFHPARSNRKLMIYHQGHCGGFILGKRTIQFFLDNGYSVMAFSMPLVGTTHRPIVDLPSFGKLKLVKHSQLKFLESNDFSPIKLFVEPVAVSLNYAEKTYGFRSIAMIGISGGGWTTTLYSALDPRISRSYPVAGTLPIYLRSLGGNSDGDYEQFLPELYRVANYLELYILGSYGTGRKQLQVLNKYDTVFPGVRHQTYEEHVKAKVSLLGKGAFEICLDDTHVEHKISEHALNVILNDLENLRME
jgi:hypothetical protein